MDMDITEERLVEIETDPRGCFLTKHEARQLAYAYRWKPLAEKRIEGANAFERSVNEALNSGDGAYRP